MAWHLGAVEGRGGAVVWPFLWAPTRGGWGYQGALVERSGAQPSGHSSDQNICFFWVGLGEKPGMETQIRMQDEEQMLFGSLKHVAAKQMKFYERDGICRHSGTFHFDIDISTLVAVFPINFYK